MMMPRWNRLLAATKYINKAIVPPNWESRPKALHNQRRREIGFRFRSGMAASTGRHFVLIHGPCQGAWCWFKVKPLLEADGHKVTPIDLAASGIHPLQWSSLNSVTEYYQPLLSFLEALPDGEKVVLVGHSRGCFAISTATEKFPHKVSLGVYVAGILLGPTFPITDFLQAFPADPSFYLDSTITYNDKGQFTSINFGPRYYKERLAQVTSEEDLNLINLLTRPYPYFDDERSSKELALTEENFGSVKRVYINSRLSATSSSSLVDLLLSRTKVEELIQIDNSDPMLMFSAAKVFAHHLDAVAKKYT